MSVHAIGCSVLEAQKASWKKAVMQHIRLDKRLEAAVNRGLAVMLLDGVLAGLKVMREEQVPPHVMARLILGSQFHRASDWNH